MTSVPIEGQEPTEARPITRYEVLASLIEQANYSDDYGLKDDIVGVLEELHYWDISSDRDDIASYAFDAIFARLARAWTVVRFKDR